MYRSVDGRAAGGECDDALVPLCCDVEAWAGGGCRCLCDGEERCCVVAGKCCDAHAFIEREALVGCPAGWGCVVGAFGFRHRFVTRCWSCAVVFSQLLRFSAVLVTYAVTVINTALVVTNPAVPA